MYVCNIRRLSVIVAWISFSSFLEEEGWAIGNECCTNTHVKGQYWLNAIKARLVYNNVLADGANW